MRKIKQTQKPDNGQILSDFANGKRGKVAFRDAIRDDLTKLQIAYAKYTTEFSAPASICESAMQVEASAKVLLKKYESARSNQSLDFIGLRRKHHNFLCCPFCGGSGQFTLDHYLPKENGYGHYSIFSDNLIPCCSYCQGIKKQKFQKIIRNE